MIKELSAEEFLDKELQGAYTIDTEDGIEIISGIEHSEMCKILESHAAARLEAYKAEVESKMQEKLDSTPYYGHCTTEYKEGIEEGVKWVLSHLNNTPEYTEAEQNCKGCMGPCGYCEPKNNDQ